MNAKLTLNPRPAVEHKLPALYYAGKTRSVVMFDSPSGGVYVIPGSSPCEFGERSETLIECSNPHWRRLEPGEKVELSND